MSGKCCIFAENSRDSRCGLLQHCYLQTGEPALSFWALKLNIDTRQESVCESRRKQQNVHCINLYLGYRILIPIRVFSLYFCKLPSFLPLSKHPYKKQRAKEKKKTPKSPDINSFSSKSTLNRASLCKMGMLFYDLNDHILEFLQKSAGIILSVQNPFLVLSNTSCKSTCCPLPLEEVIVKIKWAGAWESPRKSKSATLFHVKSWANC